MLDSLPQIVAFVRTVELGSFTAAAKALGVSPSAVGKSVQRLEDELGVRLAHRTTRRLQLTEAGQDYFERCRRALEALEEAERSVSASHGEVRGRLRVDAPVFVGRAIAPHIATFVARNPRVSIDLTLSDRMRDPVEGGVDLVVRVGVAQVGLVGRRLGWARIAADYDLLHGGLMPLGLLAMALTPWAVRRLKARRGARPRPRFMLLISPGKGRGPIPWGEGRQAPCRP